MDMLFKVMAGGWFKGYRTQLLGWAMVLGTVCYGVVQWLVGDVDFWGMLNIVKDNWPAVMAGYMAIFLGDKVDAKK